MIKRGHDLELDSAGAASRERPRAPGQLSRASGPSLFADEAESGVFHAGPSFREGIALEQLDLEASVIWIEGKTVYLRPMERKLLTLLVSSANRVVMTRDMVASLYGDISLGAGRVRLKRLVADIRQRLGEEFSRHLRTVHRVGLVLFVARSTAAQRG